MSSVDKEQRIYSDHDTYAIAFTIGQMGLVATA
jgi:hypothetical protein